MLSIEQCELCSTQVDSEDMYLVDSEGVEERWCGLCVYIERKNGQEVEVLD